MEIQKAQIFDGKDTYLIKQDSFDNRWIVYKNDNKKPLKQSKYFSEIAKVIPFYEWMEGKHE